MTLDRDRIARALPGYEIENEVGRGAWGVVLRARHRQLDRPVAIKELPEAFAADPGVRRRFVTEARLLATLDHPHVVPIYDYVEHEGLCLLVMELLSGGTVWSRFATEGVSDAAACGIVVATCSALDYAHGKGILHRDIKPENLLFTEAGRLKVSDFGIAKVVGGAESMATRTGEVLGTPAYMAPEQALGHELTPSTDVYALGTVLYELLSGRLPFSDDGNAIALLYRHAHEDPMLLTAAAPAVPEQLAEVAMRALTRDPKERYATAEDFGVALVDSATAAWGSTWVHQGGVNVMAAGRIGERISAAGRSMDATGAAPLPARRISSLRAPETIDEPPVGDEEAGPAPVAASPDDLVPVQDVVPAKIDAPPLKASPAPAVAVAGTAKRRPSRKPFLVAVAVIGAVAIVAAGAAVLLTSGGGGTSRAKRSTPTSLGSPTVAATVDVGRGADHVAGGSSGIWVTNGPGRSVSRIDPQSNAVTPIASLDQSPHSIAVSDGSLWVTTGGGGSLLRLEPGRNPSSTRTTSVPTGKALAEVAVGSGAVWATAPATGELVRVDLKTNHVAATIGVGASPDSVAVGEGGVWVANRPTSGPGAVTRIDPASNRVVARVTVGGRPEELAVGAGSVWVANADDGTVSRIDPATNKVTATIKVGSNPQWVVVGKQAVWVTNTGSATVSRIDPATNKVTATIPVGQGAESSVVGDDSLWVVNTRDGTVSKIVASKAA